MLHDLNSEESMCSNDLQVKKTGSCGGGGSSQKPILTPDYTQRTTLAVSQLASCPTELNGSFMPIAAAQWGSKTYYFEG